MKNTVTGTLCGLCGVLIAAMDGNWTPFAAGMWIIFALPERQ